MQATIVFQKNWEAIHDKDENGNRKYRYIINEGSSRSSKTVSLIDCYDLYARSQDNKRLTVWRDTKTDCKKTVLNDTLKHLKKTERYKKAHEFNKTESIFSYNTGSTFEIHGTDDEETVHGLTQDAAWLNEPYKISRDTFDQIDQRTSDFIFIDWNPKKSHWIEDLKKDARTIVIHSTFRDNPFCPEEQKTKILSYQPVKLCDIVIQKLITEEEAKAYDLVINTKSFTEKQIKELSRCRENEAKSSANAFNWQVYGLGVKSEKPNRIFNWEEISIEKYKTIVSPTYIGVDWGAVDPWGVIEAKYYDGCLYLRELNYSSENEIRSRLTVSELAQIAGDEEGIVTWLFAKLSINKTHEVVCDTNRPNKIVALRRAGYYAMPASKPGGSILDGIDLMQNLKIYYTSDSENIAYEQENYCRKADKSGYILEEPEDMNNHLIDPARYVCLYLQRLGIIKKL
jgi:PBSX family phage terminase large subunit